MRRLFVILYKTAAAATILSDCSGGSGRTPTSPPTEPPPIVVTQNFPSGDATASGGGTAWDITQVKTTLYGQFHNASGNAYDTLRVDVTFAQDVSNALPAPGQPLSLPGQLGVSVGIDTGTDGYFPTCATAAAVTLFEFESDPGNAPGRLANGDYSLLNSGGVVPPNPGAEAITTVSGNVFSQSFLLAALGVDAGPILPQIKINVAATNGTKIAATDCVPAGNFELDASAK